MPSDNAFRRLPSGSPRSEIATNKRPPGFPEIPRPQYSLKRSHSGCQCLRGSSTSLCSAACRFTSFTARIANVTARCWFVPALGKVRPARSAVPRGSRRSSPPSRPAFPGAGARTPPVARVFPVPAACAVRASRIRTEALCRLSGGNHPCRAFPAWRAASRRTCPSSSASCRASSSCPASRRSGAGRCSPRRHSPRCPWRCGRGAWH